MKESFVILSLFFIFVPILIFSQVFLLFGFRNSTANSYLPVLAASDFSHSPDFDSSSSVYLSKETVEAEFGSQITAGDSRPILIRKYLQRFDSELEPYSDLLFEVSQKYGIDYRLMVAIAQQESNLCKRQPENCFNCWGVGIHSRGTMCFESYPQAIEWVGRYLKEEYYDLGITTVEDIMKKYCPLSSGSWANGVNQFMRDIERN